MAITPKILDEHILWAEFSRPEARNAIDFETLDELEEIVQNLEENEQIRMFVFSSGDDDDIFAAGGDLKKFHTIQSEEKAVEMSARVHNLFNRIEKLPCWTVACVNGDAYGGGVELMLSFDFRVALPKVKIGFSQGRFYLTPGWGGLTRLVEKAGKTKALLWQGKGAVIEAREALENGVIEEVLQGEHLQQEVLEWAEHLLHNDRPFIQTLKEGAGRFASAKREALEAEIKPFARLWADPEHLKRVEDFVQRKSED